MNGRLIRFLNLFLGKLTESSIEGILITSFEKYQINWRLFALVLFQSIVNSIFSGIAFKGLDIFVRDLDIDHPGILLCQLFYRDLSLFRLIFLCFLLYRFLLMMPQIRSKNLSQQVCCDFGSPNTERDRFLSYLFLHDFSLLSAIQLLSRSVIMAITPFNEKRQINR